MTSDAAVNPYPNWGAYGASKAALLHITRVFAVECAPLRVRFLAIDPGDMDTPLHALAEPQAERATLKRPAQSAREIVDAIARNLPTTESAVPA